jgi:hypothetical protein
VVVAVVTVNVVQVAIDEVIDVVAVGDRLVAAAGAVPVAFGVLATVVRRRAVRGVGGADREAVLLDTAGPMVVQVAVVQVIDVALVAHAGVTAAGAVLVLVVGVARGTHAGGSFLETLVHYSGHVPHFPLLCTPRRHVETRAGSTA